MVARKIAPQPCKTNFLALNSGLNAEPNHYGLQKNPYAFIYLGYLGKNRGSKSP